MAPIELKWNPGTLKYGFEIEGKAKTIEETVNYIFESEGTSNIPEAVLNKIRDEKIKELVFSIESMGLGRVITEKVVAKLGLPWIWNSEKEGEKMPNILAPDFACVFSKAFEDGIRSDEDIPEKYFDEIERRIKFHGYAR